MLGPYPANKNDADIMKTIIEDLNGLCKVLRTNDVFVLDSGFRDVVKDLEDKNFKVLIPALKSKRKQLSTEESNQSRFVTKIRWVVEAVHGMVKQKYRLLDHKTDNKLVPNIRIYFRVASFLNNASRMLIICRKFFNQHKHWAKCKYYWKFHHSRSSAKSK